MAHDRKRVGAGSPGHAFRHRELAVPDGGKLVLHPDGSIVQLDDAGATVARWAKGDPDWARHAIRFGVQPQEPTVAPPDSRTADSKLHGS